MSPKRRLSKALPGNVTSLPLQKRCGIQLFLSFSPYAGVDTCRHEPLSTGGR